MYTILMIGTTQAVLIRGVSLFQRCPYFKGVLISGCPYFIFQGVLFLGCYFRGVFISGCLYCRVVLISGCPYFRDPTLCVCACVYVCMHRVCVYLCVRVCVCVCVCVYVHVFVYVFIRKWMYAYKHSLFRLSCDSTSFECHKKLF